MMYELIVNNPLRLAIASILNIIIIDNSFIFLNVWSLVHLFSGGLITYILFKIKIPKKFILGLLFLILVFYEIVEYPIYTNLTSLFIPETSLDLIWDLIVGMIGGFLVFIIKNFITKKKEK